MADETLRILIVDDSPEDREFYRRLILQDARRKYELLETESGEEGLEICRSGNLDCVLLDYRVPDLDGLQFLAELVDKRGWTKVAVIMLTGQGDESIAVKAMKSGAQDYLVKGAMTAPDLQRAIHNAVEKVSLHRKIEQQRAELEENNRLLLEKHAELEQYAYVASHDLQEPLRMVASYLQLLERRYNDKLDAEAQKYINYAVDGATRMQQLINDLLVLSRVGTRGKEFEPTDCETALDRSLANLRMAIQESGAAVTHDELPTVMADPGQLGQLLQNLISNSIKFRGSESSRVHISAKRRDCEWEFSVQDNGIGFDPQFAERIFAMFQRLHGKTEYPGTGIGLAICKKIVQRHGGRIWARSEPGKGATFFFTVPIPDGKSSAAVSEPAEAAVKAG